MCCVLLYDMIYITFTFTILSLSKKIVFNLSFAHGEKTWKLIVFCLPCEFYFVFVSWLLLTVGKSLGYSGMDEQRILYLKKVREYKLSEHYHYYCYWSKCCWIWENMLSTGNEVRWTSPANHLQWSHGQCHQMLPGLSVYRAYNVCYLLCRSREK